MNLKPATIDAMGVITLDGSAGTVVVSASQSGNAFVNEATATYLNIVVSDRTRPTILFTDSKKEGDLAPVLYGSRAIPIPGAYASNGGRLHLTSSNPSIVEVVANNRIIAHQAGSVTLELQSACYRKFCRCPPKNKNITCAETDKI